MTEKLYATRDIEALDDAGNHYYRNIMAMTSEGLNSKSDIAAELGFRDMQISALAEQVRQLTEQRDAVVAEFAKFKTAHPQPFGPEMMKALEAYECHQDDVPETGMLNAFFILRDSIVVETPATSAILDSLRAEGVEMLAESYEAAAKDSDDFKFINHCNIKADQAREFACQLRESKGVVHE